MKFSNFIPLILLILVLLVGSSCSCAGDGGTPTPTPTPTGTPTPTPSPTANATVTPTPVTEYLEYIDEENGFAISYPQEWEKLSPEYWAEQMLVYYWAGEADMKCGPQFYVLKEELYEPMSVDAWFEEQKGNITAIEGYIPISEEEMTVDGVVAIKHVFTIGYEGATFEIILLYVIEDTFGWTVVCTCVADCWSKYEPAFDTIVQSFRLLD